MDRWHSWFFVPGYLDDKGATIPNVTIIYSKFKDFVENYPLNDSYLTQSETITTPL